MSKKWEQAAISAIFENDLYRDPFSIVTEDNQLRNDIQYVIETLEDLRVNDVVAYEGIVGAIKGAAKYMFGGLWNAIKAGWNDAGIESKEEAESIVKAATEDGKINKQKLIDGIIKAGVDEEKASELATSVMAEAEKVKDSGDEGDEKDSKPQVIQPNPMFKAIKQNMPELKEQAKKIPELKRAMEALYTKFPGIPEKSKKNLPGILLGVASYFSKT